MKIQKLNLTPVRDLVAGCHDDGDGGVVGRICERLKLKLHF